MAKKKDKKKDKKKGKKKGKKWDQGTKYSISTKSREVLTLSGC